MPFFFNTGDYDVVGHITLSSIPLSHGDIITAKKAKMFHIGLLPHETALHLESKEYNKDMHVIYSWMKYLSL